MPDTTTATPYVPKQSKPRSFAGPIVMIVIGGLFLLANLRMLSWNSIFHWFANWWPLLLILYGLIKLVEYFVARNSGTQFRGVGAGGVVLVVFIILFGLSFSAAEQFRRGFMDGLNGGDFNNWFGQDYSYTQAIEQDFPAGANLKVVSRKGDIHISSWDQNKIKIDVTKKVRAESQSDADRFNQNSQVSLTTLANEVTVNTNNENKPVGSDLVIFVPKKGTVTIDTTNGDVVVQNRDGNLKITNSHGDVTVQDVTGSADVSLRHGDFHATKVSGDVTVDGRLDDVSASEIGGNLRLTGDFFGDLNISKIAKTVTFKSSRTDLQFAKLDGSMTMQSDSLRADAVNGPVTIATRSKDIELENVAGNVDVKNSNASVQRRPAEKLGQISVENKNGTVELTLPTKASFHIEATAEKGEIHADDYNFTKNSQNGDSNAAGQVGSGGPKIQINSKHGDVTIRKAS